MYSGDSGTRQLYWQNFYEPGDSRPIPGTQDAVAPFFSPDGEWVAFLANNVLSKVSLRGGQPVPLAQVANYEGGAWSPDGGHHLLRAHTPGRYMECVG